MIGASKIIWPDTGCCSPGYPGGCVCPPAEKALRAWSAQTAQVPMTAEQRDWCMDQLSGIEGYSTWLDEYRSLDDQLLAREVLGAWVEYARDKGLID